MNKDLRINSTFNGKDGLETIVRHCSTSKTSDNQYCINHNPPKLVITDNNMPLMTGINMSH